MLYNNNIILIIAKLQSRPLNHKINQHRYFEDGSAAPLNAEGACALPISPATAGLMLGPQSLVDLGCMDFMRSKMGLGVFVATAGPNKLMLHQVRVYVSMCLCVYVACAYVCLCVPSRLTLSFTAYKYFT